MIVKYFKKDKKLHKIYYDLRDKIYKELQNEDKSIQINTENFEDLPQDYFKFIYSLLIENVALRASDYYSIKIRNFNRQTDNYINMRRNKIIFNHLVKSQYIKLPFEIKLNDEQQKLLKEIIKSNKTDFLRKDDSIQQFKRGFTTRNEKYFNIKKGISAWRKFNYTKLKLNPQFKKDIMKVLKTSKEANHDLKTSLMYYI